MSAADIGPRVQGSVRPSLRWTVPAALLVAEYAVLSVLVDLPTAGPAIRLATAARMLVPAALGAVAAGWLIARRGMRAALQEMRDTLPAWRPGLPLAAQLTAFGATAWLAWRVLGPAAQPPGAARLVAVLGAAILCAVLALATAAPLPWLARFAARHLGAPAVAVCVGLLAWRAAALAEGLWGALQGMTLRGVGALLVAIDAGAVVVPEQRLVGLRGFDVTVAPVCSGVDGLGLVLVFQSLWISLARARLRIGRALLLLPVGAAVALLANVLRIATLVLVGASGREELAMGAFHSKLGWLLFIAIAFATVALAEHVAWFRRPEAEAAPGDEGVPGRAAAYVGPLFAAVATSLVTSLWTGADFGPWYAARAVAAGAVLLAVQRQLPRPALSPSWLPLALGAAVGAAAVLWPGVEPVAAQLAPPARLPWIAARVAGSCLVLPLVEELAFRGFLLPWLVAPEFDQVPPRRWTWPAVLLSSLAFGALHDQLLLGTLAGAVFACARLRRGRLSDAVLAHALANAVIAVAVLGFGRWDLWS